MYAGVETGGKQIRVREGDVVEVEKCAGEAGEEITFDRVLCVAGDGVLLPGNPTVPGAVVVARVMAQTRGHKVIVFRYKAKVNYRRKTGHRQDLTRVRIVEIRDGRGPRDGGEVAEAEAAQSEQA